MERGEETDRKILELKDAFEGETDADISARVTMLNINSDRNKEIPDDCQALREYAWLVQKIRDNQAGGKNIEEAVDEALDCMPKDFQIRSLLDANRAEVKQMCITEYDEARTMELFKAEGKEEGRIEGKLEALYSLAEAGILSMQEAAKRAGISENALKQWAQGRNL